MLEKMNPRQAEMVVCRFGGLDVAETAAALDVSEATVQRLARRQGVAGPRASQSWMGKRWERIQAVFHEAVALPPAVGTVAAAAAGADTTPAEEVLAALEEDARGLTA